MCMYVLYKCFKKTMSTEQLHKGFFDYSSYEFLNVAVEQLRTNDNSKKYISTHVNDDVRSSSMPSNYVDLLKFVRCTYPVMLMT